GEWESADASHTRYDYQNGEFGLESGLVGKDWITAYSSYFGDRGLKRSENYFNLIPGLNTATDPTLPDASTYFSKYGMHEALICPSDRKLVNQMWSPLTMYGVYSYAISLDIFGYTGSGGNGPWNGEPMGHVHNDDKPPNSSNLKGKLES